MASDSSPSANADVISAAGLELQCRIWHDRVKTSCLALMSEHAGATDAGASRLGMSPSFVSLMLFHQACTAVAEDRTEVLPRIRSSLGGAATLEADLVPVLASYRNWRFVRQIIAIDTGYTSRIARILEEHPEILSEFSGDVRLLAVKDDLWGRRSGRQFVVYADGADFGGMTKSEMRDYVYQSLHLDRRDGYVFFYTVGQHDVPVHLVFDRFMDVFGSRGDHSYCGFCDKDSTTYKGETGSIAVRARRETISDRRDRPDDTYQAPVYLFSVDCESG